MTELLNSDVRYEIGQNVWIEYLGKSKRKAIILGISEDIIKIKFSYWGVDIEDYVRDIEVFPLMIDDYINEIKFTMKILGYDLTFVENYLRKIKLLKLNNNSNNNITKEEEVFENFEIKHIEEYVLRIKNN